jgi:tetratricopeptide (TPR) repeat protein
MKTRYTESGYHITTDPKFQNKQYSIPPELEKQLETLGIESRDNTTSKTIERLTQLIVQYPTVPQLKNYLTVAHNARGNYKKAIEANNWALKEHPDYLFARLNAVHACIENKEFEKVPELLGEAFEIKSLYPERDLFHLIEVTGYLKTVVRYFAAIENLELAENRMDLLRDLAPDHPDTEDAEIMIWPLLMKQAGIRMEEENKNRIIPSHYKEVDERSTAEAPQFNHTLMQELYEQGLYFSHEKLKEIIALPRQSLIEDLEKVLQDAVNRYGYFKRKKNKEETHSFALHAYFLLAEIRAEESLPELLSFMEHDDDFLDFWIGDHITETLWQCFYTLGFSNTLALKHFLMKPGVPTYSKSCVSSALCQVALRHPEKREEILSIFSETLTTMANASVNDNLVDSEFTGLLIGDTLDCEMQELKPVIKTLYDKGYVSMGINGDYNDVEKLFSEKNRIRYTREIYSIFDLYNRVTTTWAGYNEDDDDGDDGFDDFYDYHFPKQPITSVKVGRNDPCPCGSGKKYKKCCMDKD